MSWFVSTWRFLKRVYEGYDNHAVGDSAATLGYYFLFSLFPFLFFLAPLTAFIPQVGGSIQRLLHTAHAFLPPQAMAIIEPYLLDLVTAAHPHLPTLGLAIAIYSGSRGINAVRIAFNRAYAVKESRPFWKTELLAYGITVGGGLLLLVGVAALVAGGSVGLWAARHLYLDRAFVAVLVWIRWPIIILAIMLGAGLCYYLLPDVKQRFRFIVPGAAIGTLAWLIASWGFETYVSDFGRYNITYGSIGGVVVLLTWFYITGFILLMGGEVNAIIETMSPGGKAIGERSFAGTDVRLKPEIL